MSETIRTGSFAGYRSHSSIGYRDVEIFEPLFVEQRRRCASCNCYLRSTNANKVCALCEQKELAKWLAAEEKACLPGYCNRCGEFPKVVGRRTCEQCLAYHRRIKKARLM